MSTRFIDLLWPEDTPPGWLLVWTLPDKKSLWTRSKDEAHNYATSSELDTYIEVAVGPDPETIGRPASSARIRSDEAVALPGLFADLDCSPHPSKVHFDSKEHAARFLTTLPRQPTAVVDSGGGLHAWWLFKEPWLFEDENERRLAERTEYGWTNYLRHRALESGVRDGVDHVKDLARVLRYPGTRNLKYKSPRDVRLLRSDGPRYNPADFEAWESNVVGTKLTDADLSALELRLTPDAEPPFEKLRALMDIEAKFKATWERRRSDLKDQSKSGYDMAIAQQLAIWGWDAEEIAAALIAWRRQHGLELKLRESYYSRTIAKAMAFRDQLETERAVESGELAPGGDEQLLKMIATVTGVDIVRIVRHGPSTTGRYTAVLESGTVPIGSASEVLRWDTWQKLAFAHGVLQGRPKGQRWDVVLRAMQRIVEVQEAEDAEELEVFRGWIEEHLRHEARVVKEEAGADFADNVVALKAPYRSNGHVCVNLEALRERVGLRGEKISRPDLVRLFRADGWQSDKSQTQARGRGGRRVQARYWRKVDNPDEV